MFISDRFSSVQQRIFYSILNGVYPGQQVHKMNSFQLKKFVSSLLLHTANIVCTNNPTKTKQNYILWLTNKYGIGQDMSKSDRILNFQVIMNIVNFFQQNPLIQKSINLDQFRYSKKEIPVSRKRKITRYNHNVQPEKRIKYGNDDGTVETKKKRPELVVRLCDVVKYGELYEKECFMKYFLLKKKHSNVNGGSVQLNRSDMHPVRLFNCPKIPISSDLGRKLISKEKLCLNEETKLNRINRTEWYLSQPVKKLPDIEYLVTYKPRKDIVAFGPNEHECVLAPKVNSFKLCRPLTVALVRVDDNKLNSAKTTVNKSVIRKRNRNSVGKKLLIRIKIEILKGKRQLKVYLNKKNVN